MANTFVDRYILQADDRTKAATASAQANFRRLDQTASALKTTLIGVGAAFVIQRAAGFTRDTLGMAESLADVSTKAGVTAEQLQVLRFAADQNGSSAEQLDKTLIRLQASIGLAGREALGLESSASPAGQAMRTLGVEVLDAGGNIRSTGEVFPELIDALGAVQNPAERAALAAQVFGKKIGPDLAVLIESGSKSLGDYEARLRRVGALLSNELVAKAAATKDQFDAVGVAVRANFQAGFLQAFLGDFESLNTAVTDPQLVAAINDMGQAFGTAMGGIIGLAGDAASVLASLSGELRTLAELFVAGKILSYTDGLRQMAQEAKGARAAAVEMANAQRTAADAAAAGASAAARRAEAAMLFQQMRVAEVQASLQSARGMERLTIAQTQLLPAQAALREATQAHSVALAKQVDATRASSAALVAQGQAARVASVGFITLSGVAGALGSIVSSIPILLAMQQVGRLSAAILEHREAVRDMAAEYDRFAAAQQKGISDNVGASETLLLPVESLRRATREEQDAYAKRLDQAAAYWRSVFELESRRPDGDRGLARDANVQVRAYQQAQRDLRRVLDERLQMEKAAGDRLTALKESETERITAELARQKTAYDEATRAVEEAARQRQQIEQEFADLTRPARGTLSSADVTLQSFGAQRALQRGDPEEALRQARAAADALRELQGAGDSSATLQLTAQRLQQVAREAAALQQQQAEQSRAQIAATIQDLTAQAAVLKTLPVGFDSAQTVADAQALRAAIQAELAANPIVVPVVLDRSAADTFAEQTVQGATVPGRAWGGYIPGRSPHPRADNILIRATAGELMIGRPEVDALRRTHGESVIAALLRGRLPGYAFGGLVGADIPRPALPSLPAVPAPRGGDTINLTLPGGQTYSVTADRDTSAALQRDVRLMGLKGGRR